MSSGMLVGSFRWIKAVVEGRFEEMVGHVPVEAGNSGLSHIAAGGCFPYYCGYEEWEEDWDEERLRCWLVGIEVGMGAE